MPLRYVVAYASTPSSVDAAPVKQHAVVDGTQRATTIGARASSVCGRAVRLSKTPSEFDTSARYACRSCVRLVNNPPKR